MLSASLNKTFLSLSLCGFVSNIKVLVCVSVSISCLARDHRSPVNQVAVRESAVQQLPSDSITAEILLRDKTTDFLPLLPAVSREINKYYLAYQYHDGTKILCLVLKIIVS